MKNKTALPSEQIKDLKQKTWKEKAAREIKQALREIKLGVFVF